MAVVLLRRSGISSPQVTALAVPERSEEIKTSSESPPAGVDATEKHSLLKALLEVELPFEVGGPERNAFLSAPSLWKASKALEEIPWRLPVEAYGEPLVAASALHP